jgi:ABC-type oligopeptide transport system substrate-binding subunit
MIGALLNQRYLLETELGRGGMGIVFRGRDTLLERDVAVKLVSATTLGTEGHARLLQEARAAASLNHPNIVAVYDVGMAESDGPEGGSSYIVMELVAGRSLRLYRPETLDEIIYIGAQTCTALEQAHDSGIVHRDLKPENVFIGETTSSAEGNRRWRVKLMDFGLARVTGAARITREGALMGTLSYLAPEIIQGQPSSPQSDLYALGVMLYEMAAGRPPFEAENLTAVLSQHIHAPVVPPSSYNDQIPPPIDALVVQLLAKQPQDRPGSAADVRRVLELSLTRSTPEAGTTSATPMLDRLVRGRLIGRDRELVEATELWQRAARGDGQFLLISGEPGIGKTRMVTELSTVAEIGGAKTISGACYENERTPYGAISHIVRTSFDNGHNLQLADPIMADLLTLAPELRLRFSGIPANEQLDPEAEQRRVFESVVSWCGTLTDASAILLFVDDVHWADSGTLALLRHLARRMRDRPLLIVATYREVELDEALPFQEMLRDLNRERLATRIKLGRLDKEQTGNLLATLFDEEITPELLEGIYHETEGNPFFVEEVSKALVDSGKLYFENGRWYVPDVTELDIPQGVRVAIQSRLSKLSKGELGILQVAALLGREFSYEMLRATAETDEDDLIAALESAERAQLIVELHRPGSSLETTFSFTHALIHSTLRTSMSRLRRQRLQRRVAFDLEQAFPDRHKELAPILGRYFAEAGEGERAVTYLLQAADAARRLYADAEAIDAYEQALIFLREQDDHEVTGRTLLKLGLIYHRSFAFEEARQVYEEGFAELQRAGEMPRSRAGVPTAPHPLRVLSGTSPPTIDPAQADDGFSAWCVNQLFSGLLELIPGDELVPDIAQSWEVLEDGLKYVFHLRNDVRWSDGTRVTAADFEYSWKRTLEPENGDSPASFLYDIKGARAFNEGEIKDPGEIGVSTVDDWTLVIDLERPSSYFLQILTLSVAKPVPRHTVRRAGLSWTSPETLVSNGPFLFETDGKSMTFRRNPSYHGRYGGNLEEFTYSYQPDAPALTLYENDELDCVFFFNLSGLDRDRAMRQHAEEVIMVPSSGTVGFFFEVSRPPFDDPRIRRAFALATDRIAMANRVFPGQVSPALGGFVPTGIPGHVPGIAAAYAPEQARALLEEAGYPAGRDFPPKTAFALRGGHMGELSNYLRTQWRENLGVDVIFELLDFVDLLELLNESPPDIWIIGWSPDYPDPDSFLRVGVNFQRAGWHDERYERLVEEARGLTDQRQRMALYRQAEMILVEETPLIPLFYGRYMMLRKPWVSRLPVSPIMGILAKEIILEPH